MNKKYICVRHFFVTTSGVNNYFQIPLGANETITSIRFHTKYDQYVDGIVKYGDQAIQLELTCLNNPLNLSTPISVINRSDLLSFYGFPLYFNFNDKYCNHIEVQLKANQNDSLKFMAVITPIIQDINDNQVQTEIIFEIESDK